MKKPEPPKGGPGFLFFLIVNYRAGRGQQRSYPMLLETACTSDTVQKQEPSQADERNALVEAVRSAHRAVRDAGNTALQNAFAAGEALHKLAPLVKHGEWRRYLQKHCGLNERTARVYLQLFQHRATIEAKIEANRQRAADLSLRGALKLIGKPKPPGNSAGSTSESTSSPATPPLSSLAWSGATPEQREHFVDAIGLTDWLGAMPLTWRRELEKRVDGQRAATQKDETLSKLFRSALSLQKTARNREGTSADRESASASVGAALNGFLNKLTARGLDLDDLIITVRPVAMKRARAA
jgi:Protein of unknown function (DUF3102)